jgi:hypothetical protein
MLEFLKAKVTGINSETEEPLARGVQLPTIELLCVFCFEL